MLPGPGIWPFFSKKSMPGGLPAKMFAFGFWMDGFTSGLITNQGGDVIQNRVGGPNPPHPHPPNAHGTIEMSVFYIARISFNKQRKVDLCWVTYSWRNIFRCIGGWHDLKRLYWFLFFIWFEVSFLHIVVVWNLQVSYCFHWPGTRFRFQKSQPWRF